MQRKFRFSIISILIFGMLMTACIPEFLQNRDQSEGSQAATSAAQTLEALKTQAWVGTLQAELTRVALEQPQNTQPVPIPTQIPGQATFTGEPSAGTQVPAAATQVPPTATQIPPTATQVPTTNTTPAVSSTSIPCYKAYFVKDVTIPDGTEMDPGKKFTKTWRLKNIGSCTWNTGFDLIFVSGNAMSSPATVDFPGSVQPGESIDLSVEMTSPIEAGEYKGNWKLRSDNGVVFGLGSSQDKPFWVSIEVTTIEVEIDPNKPINFAESFLSANWVTSDGKPSNEDDYENGSVYTSNKPKMEKDRVDDELALIMIPASGEDGVIIGKYPDVNIKDGDRFEAVIGCTSDVPKCDVTFEINYRIGDGDTQNLGKWNEVYDGKWTYLDIDLSSMAGKSVRFALRVLSKGSNTDDRVFWLMPRIVR